MLIYAHFETEFFIFFLREIKMCILKYNKHQKKAFSPTFFILALLRIWVPWLCYWPLLFMFCPVSNAGNPVNKQTNFPVKSNGVFFPPGPTSTSSVLPKFLSVRSKKIYVQTLRCRAPCDSLCTNGSVPCTAAETLARTLLASLEWKSGAFPLQHRVTDHPCLVSCSTVVPTFKSVLCSK